MEEGLLQELLYHYMCLRSPPAFRLPQTNLPQQKVYKVSIYVTILAERHSLFAYLTRSILIEGGTILKEEIWFMFEQGVGCVQSVFGFGLEANKCSHGHAFDAWDMPRSPAQSL